MNYIGRLFKTAMAFGAAFIMLTGCTPQRQFAYDPIYDVVRTRIETKKSTPQKSQGTTVVKATQTTVTKLDPSASALVAEAKKWIGTPYRYGGHSRSGTDCSGFVMEVFRAAVGIELPRTSKEQHKFSTRLDKSKLEVGDLVFFATSGSSGGVSHVGLYIGDNNMIHASTSRGVMISGLSEKYFVNTYHSSGRVATFKNVTVKSSPAPTVATRETKPVQSTTVTSKTTSVQARSRADEVKAAAKTKIKEAKKETKKQAKTTAKRSKTTSVKNAKAKPVQSGVTPQNAVAVSHTDIDKVLTQKDNGTLNGIFD